MTRRFTFGLGGAWLRAIIIGLIYFVAASATIMSTRFGGGVAFIWVATAVLLAELSLSSPRRWVRPLVTCGIASFIATSVFGFGLWAAGPLVIFNLAEAVIGASLLRRLNHRRGPLASLHDVGSFVVAAGIVAPAISGLGGASIAAVLGLDYWSNWASWFAGHALGTVAFAPIVGAIMRRESHKIAPGARRKALIQNGTMLALILVTDVAVFWNNSHPLLFLPILVVMMATIWRGQFGAGVSILLLALVGGFFTIAGPGSTAESTEAIASATVFFQFYLAVTVLTVLPVAADLTRRKLLHEKLLASEARYRLVTENSSDLILNLDPEGTILYASQSIAELGDYSARDLVGMRGSDLVLKEDRHDTNAIFVQALSHPDKTFTSEFRGVGRDGTTIWFEMRCRGVVDDDGSISGVVSSIRDIADRKVLEDQLTHEASTDFLTGLPNRRAFMGQLETLSNDLSTSNRGCVAIVDLDHFKSVNDLHGHLIGDEILQSFSKCASSVLRGADVIARIGGEEFGLIFYGASIEQATAICERLRSQIEGMRFQGASENVPIRLTISAGVAELKPGKLIGDVLAGADAALYRAKAAGRNRLALAA